MSVHEARPLRPISWWRSLGVSALAFALLAAAAGALWIGGRPSRAYSAGPGSVALSAFDYGFSPDRMTWRAGERVTLTLTNDLSPPLSASFPSRSVARGFLGDLLREISPTIKGAAGKQHELMLGRGPVTEDTAFGRRYPGGFETDFFAGVDVEVVEAEKLAMLMPGDAYVSGAPMAAMSGMEMGGAEDHGGEAGFMLMLDPGGRATIRFVVPNKPGRWQFACFQQSGQHYTNGMNGWVTVERA